MAHGTTKTTNDGGKKIMATGTTKTKTAGYTWASRPNNKWDVRSPDGDIVAENVSWGTGMRLVTSHRDGNKS